MSLRSFFTGTWATERAEAQPQNLLPGSGHHGEVRPELLPFDLSAELNVRCDLSAWPIAAAARNCREGSLLRHDTITGDMPSAPPPSSRPPPGARTRNSPAPGSTRRAGCILPPRRAAAKARGGEGRGPYRTCCRCRASGARAAVSMIQPAFCIHPANGDICLSTCP